MTPSLEQETLRDALASARPERSRWAALRWRHRHGDAAPPVVGGHADLLGELWCDHRVQEALPPLKQVWSSDARLLRALAVLGGPTEHAVLLDALSSARPSQQRQVVGALVASGACEVLERLLSVGLPDALWVHAVLREIPSHVAVPLSVLRKVEAASLEVWAAALEAPVDGVGELRELWLVHGSWQGLPASELLDLNSGLLARRFSGRAAGHATEAQVLRWLPRLSRVDRGPLLRQAPHSLLARLQERVRSWLSGRSWDDVEASLLPPEVGSLAVMSPDSGLLDLLDGPVPESLLDLFIEQAPWLALERLPIHAHHAETAAVLVNCCAVHGESPPALDQWRAVVQEAERRGALEQRTYRRLARAAVADGMGRLRSKKKTRKKKRR